MNEPVNGFLLPPGCKTRSFKALGAWRWPLEAVELVNGPSRLNEPLLKPTVCPGWGNSAFAGFTPAPPAPVGWL
jgi:hypothetical protein